MTKGPTAHLRSSIQIHTTDYHGNPRSSGGDPVSVELRNQNNDLVDSKVKDNDDGSYDILFLPSRAGKLTLSITIFGRHIKDSPMDIEVGEHVNPIWRFGCRGTSARAEHFNQPVRVASGSDDTVYVLDTGNSRIKVFGKDGSFLRHLGPTGVENQSATGLSLMSSTGHLAVVNWRSKTVSILDPVTGSLVRQFGTPTLVEPIDLAVTSRDEILVADSGTKKIFKFDSFGNLMSSFGSQGDKDGQFKVISALCVGRSDEILVADHRIQVFNKDGKYLRKMVDSGTGQYGGVAMDSAGTILATKTEKMSKADRSSRTSSISSIEKVGSSLFSSSSVSGSSLGIGGSGFASGGGLVHLFHSSGRPLYSIDSFCDRLKRPNGLAVVSDFRVVVADLGNNCIKKYYYK